MRHLKPFFFEVILIEHESEDQPTLSEGFQVDVLYQMSLLEPAIQHQPEGDTTVHSNLLVWLKEMMVLQKTLCYRKYFLKEKKLSEVTNLKRNTLQEEPTLVPEVFLDISPHERAAREPRSGEHESRSGEKEKPLVTLDLNLTFMQTPAVKRVNLIIQKVTKGSLAITCLSAANVSTRVVRSGIF